MEIAVSINSKSKAELQKSLETIPPDLLAKLTSAALSASLNCLSEAELQKLLEAVPPEFLAKVSARVDDHCGASARSVNTIWPPPKPTNMSQAALDGFIKALIEEYVDDKGPAVGVFLDSGSAKGLDSLMMNSVEDHVRSCAAPSRTREIETLRQAWGTSQVNTAAARQETELTVASAPDSGTSQLNAAVVRRANDLQAASTSDSLRSLSQEDWNRVLGNGTFVHEKDSEKIVYHCTLKESAESIMKTGFRFPSESDARSKGLKLGAAVYFGESKEYCVHEALNTFSEQGFPREDMLSKLALLEARINVGQCVSLGAYNDFVRTGAFGLSPKKFAMLTNRLTHDRIKLFGHNTISIMEGTSCGEIAIYDRTPIIDLKVIDHIFTT